MEAKKREREEQHLYLTAKVRLLPFIFVDFPDSLSKVITDDTFSQHEGFDLASFDERNWPASDLPTFRVLKNETYSTFKARVAQHFNYPENQIRLWVLVNRQNKTVRPDTHIPENEPALSRSMFNSIPLHILTRSQPLRSFGITWRSDSRMTSGCTST